MPAKKGPAKGTVPVNIPQPQILDFGIGLIGVTPTISNAFPQKIREKLVADHMHMPEALIPHEAKDPCANFSACIHYVKSKDGGVNFAMPGSSFKGAMVAACRMTNKKLDMASAKQFFQVIPFRVQMYGDEPIMCEHRVRNDNGGVDIRHRAMYCRWSVILPIRYHAGSISKESLIYLAELAGFGCGIGDWRIAAPKSPNGQMGAFRVAREGEIVGPAYSKWCAKNPFDWDEFEQYGIVPPARVEYYRKAAEMVRGLPPEQRGTPKKGKSRKAVPTAAAAAAIINGVQPVDGLEPPDDGYVPQQ
jgi:hypothetical protein